LALVAATLGATSCAVPVGPARTGEVVDAGRIRLRGTWNLLAVAPSRATLLSGNEERTQSGEYADAWTAYRSRSARPGVDAVASVFLSVEGQLAYGIFERCELGGQIGLMRVGMEVRCAPLDQDTGAPLAVALSLGIAQQMNLNPVDADRYHAGQELRAGLDISKRIGDLAPLVNVNLGYLPQYREIQGSLPAFQREEWAGDQGDINVVRNELRLSVPVGIALFYESGPAAERHLARIVFGLVPEITLNARNRRAPQYESVDGSVVSNFEQHWGLFLVVGAEIEP
jgi:hypothetical protein